jgi:hypothetical protein
LLKDTPILDELDKWPDKIMNKDKEVVLFGTPDGVGAFRKKDGSIVPCLIEVKQGTKSYSGSSGIRKHLRDMVILANHTIKDRKEETEFSYSYRKQVKENIEWSEDAPLLLFILQTSDSDAVRAEKVLRGELKKVNTIFDNKLTLDDRIAKVDIEFVFTNKIDGTDFISCYTDKKKHFKLIELI